MQAEMFEAQDEVGTQAKRALVRRYPWWAIEEDPDGANGGGEPGQLFESTVRPEVIRYGSGASAFWDFLGYRKAGAPVGITAIEIGPDVIEVARDYAAAGGKVFLDSGAFSALSEGRVLDFEREVFPIYEAMMADGKGASQMLVVMPDRIGDPAGSLELQRKYAADIRRWMDLGIEAMFPIQATGQRAIEWFRTIEELVDHREFVTGIPSNACAWTMDQVLHFAKAVQPKRMHLLGLGKKQTVDCMAARVAEVSAKTVLTCDSCQILANVGQGRRLTDRAQTRLDAMVAEALSARPSETVLMTVHEYLFDVCHTPGFLTTAEAVALGAALGYSTPEWAEKFAQGAAQGMWVVLASLDPEEEWLDDVLRAVVVRDLYEPMLRKMLSGPVRAYEVARMVMADNPEWVALKRRMESAGWRRTKK
ncbi:MAG: hypothetical protein E6R08_00400 [Nevskiaceae bacterium]|nr:MAG: hypothetical protein E6R08_00400 [Nevskiaceae bacterium]